MNEDDGQDPASTDTAANVIVRMPPGVGAVYNFDGKGGVTRDMDESPRVSPHANKGFTLVVGSLASPEFRLWLKAILGEVQANALCVPSVRTRCQILDDKASIVLRVARPGATAEDVGRQMMGIWLERGLTIIATDVNVAEMMGLNAQNKSTFAPVSPADFVARLALRVSDRIEPLIESLSDQLDRIEESMMTRNVRDQRGRLANLRSTLIAFRRLLWPQRDVLNTLEIEDLSFFNRKDRARLREASTRTARLGDELQALSERAVLVHEYILDQRAEQSNRSMLILAAVTTVFMPLTLITGILGMNVSGIPFASNAWSFAVVLVLLVVLGGIQFFWFRRNGWFR